jgi:hypothetical protein
VCERVFAFSFACASCFLSSLYVRYLCWTVLFWIKRECWKRAVQRIFIRIQVFFFYIHDQWIEEKKEKNVQSKKIYSYIYIYIIQLYFLFPFFPFFSFKPSPMNELEKIKRRKNLGNMHIGVLYTQLWT